LHRVTSKGWVEADWRNLSGKAITQIPSQPPMERSLPTVHHFPHGALGDCREPEFLQRKRNTSLTPRKQVA
jgi:hypothetical protein